MVSYTFLIVLEYLESTLYSSGDSRIGHKLKLGLDFSFFINLYCPLLNVNVRLLWSPNHFHSSRFSASVLMLLCHLFGGLLNDRFIGIHNSYVMVQPSSVADRDWLEWVLIHDQRSGDDSSIFRRSSFPFHSNPVSEIFSNVIGLGAIVSPLLTTLSSRSSGCFSKTKWIRMEQRCYR